MLVPGCASCFIFALSDLLAAGGWWCSELSVARNRSWCRFLCNPAVMGLVPALPGILQDCAVNEHGLGSGLMLFACVRVHRADATG